MRTTHLMIPGLARRHLDGGWLPRLKAHPVRQRATLVCSFPATIPTLETTLRTGWPPSTHGVVFEDDPVLSPLLLGTHEDLRHERTDLLVQEDGGATDADRLARLDHRLDEILRAHPGDELLLISGGPPMQECSRQIEIDEEGLRDEGFRLRRDPAFALCEAMAAGTELSATRRARWLDTVGIERILAPDTESAGSWMAPVNRGWFLIAEPGASFLDTPSCAGHREPSDPGSSAVLLAFGPEWSTDWPGAVHDWRVAPTLLAAAGQGGAPTADTALAGARALRG